MIRLSISLLGPLQVTLDGERTVSFATDKARALLAYLAVEADRPHRRETLAGLLWPDQPERKARHSLRQALSHLRQALKDRDGLSLQVSRGAIQFELGSDCWLDVAAFTGLVADCQTHRHRRLVSCRSCLRRLEEAVALYRGEFLEQLFVADSALYEEWALLKREWLHRLAVEALSNLAEGYERRRAYGKARPYAWRQVELEPWREEAHRQLMRLLALDGQRSAALAQYETCRRALAEELGVEPTPETTSLYERIRAEEDIAAVPLHRLPPAPTPFVGRARELAELADLLANPDCRLVTIVGPGGIGKTRLALQAAQDQVGAFDQGIHFVPLAAVGAVELVEPMIADALGFSFHGQQDPRAQLLSYLRGKEMLLVLDNLEHLLAGSALLAEVLKRAPRVVFLVTSRERLNLQEEWVYEVEGLAYPKDHAARELEDYDAVMLFVQSARRAQRRFTLVEREMPFVERICQMVEGMPLGVELAAAGVRARTCEEIVRELERNLDVLATSLRNVPERHRSLRAAFEHSWQMLSEQEREVFRRLSVFRGGFDKEAAQHVAGASPATLLALVDKSLLRRDLSGRYEVHELLRQYAREKLQDVPQRGQKTLDLHCGFFAGWLKEREKWLQGGRQKEALEQIGLEVENVRAGWRWAVVEPKAREIAQFLKSLSLFYEMRSWYQEGAEAFSKVVDALLETDRDEREGELDVLLGRVLAHQGRFLFHLGQYEKAQKPLEESLEMLQRCEARPEMAFPLYTLADVFFHAGEYERAERLAGECIVICRAYDDRHSMAQALSVWGEVAARRGDYADTKRHYQQGLEICREMQDLWGMAGFLSALGGADGRLGEYLQAQERFEEALTIFQEIGNRRGIAACLHNLSTLAYLEEEFARAKQLRQETLNICQEIGFQWGVASSLRGLGDVARKLGEYAEAEYFLQESLTILEEMGDRSGQALTLNGLGNVAKVLGDAEASRGYFRRALEAAVEIQALPIVLGVLAGMAELLSQVGKVARAYELILFILHHPASEKQTQDQMEHLRSELVSQLSPQVMGGAEERAQAMTLEEVVEEIATQGDS